MVEAHSQRAHSKLSPSGAHRWLECPGSIAASEGIPEKRSKPADEGTAAHTYAEYCFKLKIDADAHAGWFVCIATGGLLTPAYVEANGQDENAFEIDEEMVEGVQLYLDFIRELCNYDPDAIIESETRLDLTHIRGMESGTGDFSAYLPNGATLHIVDFKYGKGVLVEVDRNPQLRTYGSGTMRRYQTRGLKNVVFWVVQPRAPHPKGPIRAWECSPLDLMDFEADLQDGADKALAPDAPRHAGEWCKFCPAAGSCDTNREAAYSVALDIFGNEAVADTMDCGALAVVGSSVLTPDALAHILGQAAMLKNWLRAVEVYAHDEALAGRLPTGYKLVDKRPTRRWLGDDPEALVEDLVFAGVKRADLYTAPKVKSPAQVEPLMPGKNKTERAAALRAFAKPVSSGTNLVPIADERQSSLPSAEEMFT